MEHVLLPVPSQQQQQQQGDHAPIKSAETEERPLGQAALHRDSLPTAVAASASHSSSPAEHTSEGAPATIASGPRPSASSTDSMTAREAGTASSSSGDEPMCGSSARTSDAVDPQAASTSSTSAFLAPNTQQDAGPHPPPAPASNPENCRHDSVGQPSTPHAAPGSSTHADAADNLMRGEGATAEQALADSLTGTQPQLLSHIAADDSESASHSAASHLLPSSTQSRSDCSHFSAIARHGLSPTTARQADEVQASAAEAQHLAEQDQGPTTASLDGQTEASQADAPAHAKQEEEEQQAWGSSAQGKIAEQHASSSSLLEEDNQQADCHVKEEEEHQGAQKPSQLPQGQDEHLSECTAPLPQVPSAGAGQEGVQQLQSHAEVTQANDVTHCAGDVSRHAAEAPQAKKKPGFFAKAMFCTVFSPILVPVLAVGGFLQMHDALSVQRRVWTYSG